MQLYTDGTDIVCAENPHMAKSVWEMTIGDLRTYADKPLRVMGSFQKVTIIFDMHGNVPDSGDIQIPPTALTKVEDGQFHFTANAQEWAAVNKPCVLCYIAPDEENV